MKNSRLLIFLFVFLGAVAMVSGQVVSDAFIQKELDKRGLERSEVEAAMLAKGVDLNTVDINNPAEIQRVRGVLEEVIAELEAGKESGKEVDQTLASPQKKSEPSTSKEKADALAQPSVNDDQILQAVKEGSTVEEAVAEVLSEDLVGQLPDAVLYGHHLYRKKNIKFYTKSTDARPPSNYIIGPGDAVAIEIWGVSEESMSLKVNNDGFIKPDEMPRIYLVGLTLDKAEALIKSRFRNYYRFDDSNFEVNISTARTINVNISGEVFDPGNYNISALNNAINALVAAGGPSDIGSVRMIKLIQSGKVKTIDLYQYLNNPIIEQEYYLAENDYIVVPIAEKVVTIRGAINKPYKYELLPDEGLVELIRLAGGLKYNAFRKNVQVKRIEDDVEQIIDVDLSEVLNGDNTFQLKNGDEITVNTIPKAYQNIVSISGAVEIPGEFAFEEGMKIADLLEKGRPDETALLNFAYLIRLNDDLKTVSYETLDLSDALVNRSSPSNINLRRGDRLEVRSGRQFAESYTVSVSGAVRNPGEFALNNDDLRLSDVIFLSNGLLPLAEDFGYIIRKEPDQLVGEYININVKEAVENPSSSSNINLRANDSVVIFNKLDFSEDFEVSISGAVKEEGTFEFVKDMSIKDLITRAGGLSFNADRRQVDVFRLEFAENKKTKTLVANVQLDANNNVVSGDDFDLRPFDEVVVRAAAEFEYQKFVTINGELAYPGKYALIKDNMRLSDMVRQAGGLTSEAFIGGATLFRNERSIGNVIIDLEEAMRKPGGNKDLILQEGDVIAIPKISHLVSISGATNIREVYNGDLDGSTINLAFEDGKNAKYYIDKYAGGFADNADRSKVMVKYPNGEIKKSKRFLFFRRYPEVRPGSAIEVRYKVEEVEPLEGEQESKVDWGEVLSNSVAQATAVLSLVLLLRSLD